MMHPIDALAAVMVRYGPRRVRVFPGGWGEDGYVEQLGSVESLVMPPQALEISWTAPRRESDRVVRDGTFTAITDVPAAAATGAVRVIEPPGGTDRMCLLMAAWNDHGYNTRQQLSNELLHRGIASLILEIPYYGSRRAVGTEEQPIQTVADFARMGLGAVTEGRALLSHFRRHYQMGVSGYSMGGNIAAMIGATAGFPVAIAPLAASHSPGPVFLDGVISNGIKWEALGGPNQRERLREALTGASVLRLAAPPWTAAAVMVAARNDGFVPATAVAALHRHWPGAELRWRRGGHATLLWRQRAVLADAVAASFDRLTANQSA
jgi:hypothetical protein